MFPFCWALLPNKQESTYTAVLKRVDEKVVFVDRDNVTHKLEPKIFISDHEHGLRNARREVWPNAKPIKCWFHTSQVCIRQHFIFFWIIEFESDCEIPSYKPLSVLMFLQLLYYPSRPFRSNLGLKEFSRSFSRDWKRNVMKLPLIGSIAERTQRQQQK